MREINQFFASDGALSSILDGYTLRQQQLDLSLAIANAMQNKQSLLAEAGTGTGKTFAYLAPAILNDQQVIVSTGTKNLQEQLYKRDLPLIKNLINKQKQSALLKGRSNYLCLHRLHINEVSERGLDKTTLREFKQVQQWRPATKSGDMSELTSLKEDASVLPLVTSTIDNCLGKDCSFFDDCFVVKARKKALQADIVVVNHHLFFADLALKEKGFGELIPHADSIIFDEAHLIPDIASEYFGQKFSTRQLSDLLSDVVKLQKVALKDADQLSLFAEKCKYCCSDLRMLFAQDSERGEWLQALKNTQIAAQVETLEGLLAQLLEVAELNKERDNDMDALVEKLEDLAQQFSLFTKNEQSDVSLWYETSRYHLSLHLTPLSIAKQFTKVRNERDASWIFTSATLAIDNKFEHFQKLMGLQDATAECFSSPFDYQKQALLCVPRYLPEPNSPKMKQALADIAVQLIQAAKGSAFILFTSHYMMRTVAELVETRLDTPILVQGQASKAALLKQYLAEPETALFATGAFWEGVDVKGDDLRCVMIDKLPFAAPDDPLFKARLDDCRKQGGAPFFELQIPQAAIALKQGAGRLIRDNQDSGVLVICDNRLVSKSYASTFISSLPDMKRTRDLQNAIEFLSSTRKAPQLASKE